MRALATIDTIRVIEPHPGADRLDIATVRGWRAVVQRGQFQPGQRVLFIEPDAQLSEDEARWAFLMKNGVRTSADGFRGHVLRTVRLRGEVSQGLVLDTAAWPELAGLEGDVTAMLPLRLWEPVVPASADIAGPFPSGIPKTDEDRVQNLSEERFAAFFQTGSVVSVTEKLDGTSVTAFATDEGAIQVCGRNWLLSTQSEIHRFIAQSPQAGWLRSHPGSYAQGEIIGPKVRGNKYGLDRLQWRLFTVGRVGSGDRMALDRVPSQLRDHWVPVRPAPGLPRTFADLIDHVDGIRSALSDIPAEGLVIRCEADGRILDSMKVINRTFLLAGRE